MNKVAIIVVTYNRKQLLKENILALKNQTYTEFDLLIIDNASTDGTYDYIEEYINESILYFNTGENLGGAGGFSYGLKLCAEKEYKYAWIMDDDTIPEQDSLKSLIDKAIIIHDDFSYMCSLVKWTDGTPCNMNIPVISKDWIGKMDLIKENLLPIDSCSFVACFINMKYVHMLGLPIKEYFIYGDDIEYTERLSSKGKSYIDLSSIVVHKMANNMLCNIVSEKNERLERYKYRYRNLICTQKRKSKKSCLKEVLISIRDIIYVILYSSDFKIKRISMIIHGIIHGFFFKPKIEMIKSYSR
ncbi:glycosyltransferase [Clostridium butyricum]